MEKFTNDRNKFIEQIKIELLDFENQENWISKFQYVEIPFFLFYAYSVDISINMQSDMLKMRMKNWEANYNLSRFQLGIYNLDRLAILERNIILKQKTSDFFRRIKYEQLKIIDFKGIILDGLTCELIVMDTNQHLKWNIDKEMNIELQKLVENITLEYNYPKL